MCIRWKFYIFVMSVIILGTGCSSGSGDTVTSPNSDDDTLYFTLWEDPPSTTNDQYITLGGFVGSEYLLECPIIPYYPPIDVTISYEYTTSGESGSQPANWVFANGYNSKSGCRSGWHLFDIPLAWGMNEIIITATADLGIQSEIRVNIRRIPESPDDFSVRKIGDTLQVNWSSAAEGASTFNLFYSTDSTFGSHEQGGVSIIENVTPPYYISDLDPDIPYYLSVAGVTKDGSIGDLAARSSVIMTLNQWRLCSLWDDIDSGYLVGRPYFDVIVDSNDSNHLLMRTVDEIGYVKPPSYMTNASGNWKLEHLPVSGHAAMAINAANRPEVIYAKYDGYDLAYANQDISGDWVGSVIDSNSYPRASDYIIDKNTGVAHAVFLDTGSLKYTTNLSGIWVTTTLINDVRYTTNSTYNSASKIIIDESGAIHILFVAGSNVLASVYATNTSGAWDTQRLFSADPYMDLLIDRDGDVHIAQYNDVTREIDILNQEPIDGDWVIAESYALNVSGYPTYQLRFDSNNRPYVVYSVINSSRISYAYYDNSVWVNEELVNRSVWPSYLNLSVNSNDDIDLFIFDDGSLLYLTTRTDFACELHEELQRPPEENKFVIPVSHAVNFENGNIENGVTTLHIDDSGADMFWGAAWIFDGYRIDPLDPGLSYIELMNNAVIHKLSNQMYYEMNSQYDADPSLLTGYNYSYDTIFFDTDFISPYDIGDMYIIRTNSYRYYVFQIIDFQHENHPSGSQDVLTLRYRAH